MEKLVVPALALVVLATSCSTKNEVPENPEQPKENWYLYGWVEKNPDDPTSEDDLFKIEYNADSSVRRLITYYDKDETSEPGVVESVTYENGQLVRYDVYLQSESPFNSTTYEHKNGRAVRGLNYSPAMGSVQLELHSIDSFFYDNAGQLAYHKEYFQQQGYSVTPDVTEYTWANGNIVNVKLWKVIDGKNTMMYNDNFEYSNYKNFTRSYFDNGFVLYGALGDILNKSRNLCVKKFNAMDNPAIKVADTVNFRYTFGENGLPVSKEATSIKITNGERETWRDLYTYDFRKRGS